MKRLNGVVAVGVVVVSIFGTSGCGMGGKLMKSLSFATTEEGGHLFAGFDARVAVGVGALPDVKLPIYDPKSPARFLGYMESHSDGSISVRVDVTETAKIEAFDGSFLPNGREIPIVMPSGVRVISVPVINSNSKVYLAVGEKNIMAGVAITLLANTASGNSDWLNVLRSLPANIFYPFTAVGDVKGTAGLFTGDKVGVSIFAVKALAPVVETLPAFDFASISSATNLARVRGIARPFVVSSEPEVFGVKTQSPTGSKLRKIERALAKARRTRLD